MDVTPQAFDFDGHGVRLAGERWDGASGGSVVVLLHGDSGWHPSQDYWLDGFVGDLADFVATLERPPVLVGASLGGITALRLRGLRP